MSSAAVAHACAGGPRLSSLLSFPAPATATLTE